MKETFRPPTTISNITESLPKKYPKTSMKELCELDQQGTPEDWLNFFKRYDLVAQEVTLDLLKTQPVAIQRTDIAKSFVRSTFINFVREEWKGDWEKIGEKISHVSIIKKKEDHPKSYWENLTQEQFIEELQRRHIDCDNPPNISKLGYLWTIIRGRPDLRKTYNTLREPSGKKIQLRSTHYNNIEELALEFAKDLERKETTIEEFLQNKKNLRRLGLSPRWSGRIQRYGGRKKFYEDLGNLFGIKPIIKTQLSRNYYFKLTSSDWQKKMQESGIDINQPIKHSEIYNKMSGGVVNFINKIGREKFEEIADIKFLEEKPSGWLSAFGLSEELKTISTFPNLGYIKKVAEELKTEHLQPEWSKYYISQQGRYIEHYSPELVEEIIKFFTRKHKTTAMIDSTESNKWLKDLLEENTQGGNDDHTENVTE